MALRNDIELLLEQYQAVTPTLAHNETLFEIYEGRLLPYVLQDLKKQLSDRSYEQIVHRVPPINILIKLIDKLSKIYAKPPAREIVDGTTTDQALYDWYVTEMDLNTFMGIANEFFNLFKNCAIEPFIERGVPKLRVVPADRFFVYSKDQVNPTRVTHYTKCMGKIKVGGEERNIFYSYTDDEFLAYDDRKQVLQTVLDELENPDGINVYGKIPAVYVNRSRHKIMPNVDTDTLAMTKLFPVLLSDANFANMFQSFSVIYGIDVDDKNIVMGPNSFLSFRSDPTTGNKPEIGVIKPEVDTEKTLNLIKSQLAIWMQTRNIKPGAMGDLTADNAASGISKVIDEMDTSDDRQKQVSYFANAEKDLAELIMHHMHPVFIRDPEFMEKRLFSQSAKLNLKFSEQKPIIDPQQLTTTEIAKMNAGLQSRRGALKVLNPEFDDVQINELIAEIDGDLTVEVVEEASGEVPDDGEEEQGRAPAAMA